MTMCFFEFDLYLKYSPFPAFLVEKSSISIAIRVAKKIPPNMVNTLMAIREQVLEG